MKSSFGSLIDPGFPCESLVRRANEKWIIMKLQTFTQLPRSLCFDFQQVLKAFHFSLLMIIAALVPYPPAGLCATSEVKPIILDPSSLSKGLSLDKHIEYFIDESRQISSQDILKSKQAHFLASQRNLHFAYTPSHVWLRFTLENPSDSPHVLELNQQFPMLDYLSIHQLKDQQLHLLAEAGDSLPAHSRPGESRMISFRLEVPAHSSQTFYLKAYSTSTLALPLTLWDAAAYGRFMSFDNAMMGLFFGVLIGLLFYNLLLIMTTRLSRAYVLYIGFMISNILFYLAWTGVGTQYIWPHSQFFIQRGFPLFAHMVCVFILAFQIVFLDLAHNLPRIRRLYLSLIGLYSLIILAILSGIPVHLIQKFTTLGSGGMTALLSSAVAITLMLRGNRQALFFTVAYSFFLIFIIMGAILAGGFVDLPISLSIYGAQIGSAVECILLAIGLADRINELHRKTRDAQQQALRLQQDLVQEREASEKIQHLEAELRFKLASSIAHRINNPLNYIQYGLAAIGRDHHNLKDAIFDLLGHEPSVDPDMLACQQRFTKILAEFEGPIHDIRLAIGQTAEFVEEIRALSGVDGGSIQLIMLEEFLLRTYNALSAVWPADVNHRISINFTSAQYQEILGNPYFLRSALDVLFSVSIDRSKGNLDGEFRVKSPHAWMFVLRGEFNWEKSIALALERCLNHILCNSGTRCHCTFSLHELLVDFHFSDQMAAHSDHTTASKPITLSA
jgi:signal transduction histidine kinase